MAVLDIKNLSIVFGGLKAVTNFNLTLEKGELVGLIGPTANPYTVAPETTIADAMVVMREKNIRRMPVVKNGKLVGIISEKKLLEVSPSPATSLSVFEINYLLSKTKIESVMTKNVITISSDNLLEEAAIKMRDNHVGSLPVVDNGKLVGIITESNVFDAFIEILGTRDHGSRIAIEVIDNKPGVAAKIASIIAGFDVNITHLVFLKSEIVARVNTLNIDSILKALEDNGFKVISVIKNR